MDARIPSVLALSLIPGSVLSSQGADVPRNEDNRKNVVLIITDQQQASKIGYLGDTGIRTPMMDRIAEDGVVFTNARCTFPLSAPQRFSMFTGLYPASVGFRFNTRSAEDRAQLDWEKIDASLPHSLANIFKAAGYRTYYGGKSDIPSRESNLAPEYYGFETVYSTDERDMLGIDFARAMEQIVDKDKPFFIVASFLNPHDICLFDKFYGADSFSEQLRSNNWAFRSLERVYRAANRASMYSENEFFERIAPPLPENLSATGNVPEGLMGQKVSKDLTPEAWRYYRYIYDRLVEEVDMEIAPVLASWEKFKENTILVFMSDHGEMNGSHRLMWKSYPYEEAQKVPFIISGPGLKKGVIDSTTCVNTGVDLIPTLCELADIPIPSGLEGKSVAGACVSGRKAARRKYTFHEGQNWLQVIEDGRFKYTVISVPDADTVEMLVDLQEDPGEMRNLAGQREYARVQARLSKEYQNHLKLVKE